MKMIGIVDEFGIESFIPLEGHYKEVFLFIIRCKINLQRNAVFFCLDFTDEEIDKINNLIEAYTVQAFIEAGMIVTEKLDSINKSNHTETNKMLNRIYKLRGYL